METLRTNVNSKMNYPDQETMKLFLQIGKETRLFDGIEKHPDWNYRYKNVDAIITLAIISDYLCQQWKEQEKQSFLDELRKNDNEFYKRMGELALNIWEWKWNLSNFSKSLINENRKVLKNSDSSIWCFPTIRDKDSFPKRINEIRGTTMIHEKFEAELTRLNWIQEWANQIQQTIKNHNFDRWDNSDKIWDLESRL